MEPEPQKRDFLNDFEERIAEDRAMQKAQHEAQMEQYASYLRFMSDSAERDQRRLEGELRYKEAYNDYLAKMAVSNERSAIATERQADAMERLANHFERTKG